MRPRNTLIALAVLAGLVLWIYLYEYRGEEGREKAKEAEKKVLVFDAAKADGLDLVRPGGEVRLRKEGGEWRLTAPLIARADGEEVSSLLSTLSWLEADRRIPAEGADLEGFKLVEPPLKIVVRPGEGAPPLLLAVGDKTPIGSGYYARAGGSGDILTISSSIDRLIEATADKLRYKKVVGLDSWNVSKFSVARGGALTAFAKSGEAWRIESPHAFPADRGKVWNLLTEITGATAEGFEPEGTAPASVGLEPPEATIRLEEKDGKATTVALSAKDASGIVRARRGDMPDIFRVKGEVLDKITPRAEEVRDSRVAPVDRFEISEVRAATPEGEKILMKDAESNWRWGSSDGPALEARKVEDLLSALDEARATSYVEGPEAVKRGSAPGAPELTLTVKAGATPPTEVVLGAEESGQVPVRSTASDAIYMVEKAAADKLVRAVRDLQPPAPPPADGKETTKGGEHP